MSLKMLLRSLAEAQFPYYMHRRFVRQMAATEVELKLLPALVPADGLCVDVGANRGLYIEHLLPLTKNIVAFEPIAPLQAWLNRVFGSKVQLMSCALSDHEGRLEIRYPKGNYSWATISTTNALDKANTEICSNSVQIRTLDSYTLSNVAFIKIDVEGHEEAVVAGARSTIAAFRPNFLIEVEERHNGGSVGRTFALFESLDYSGVYVEDGVVKDIAEFDLARDQNPANVTTKGKVGQYINNFMFIPREKSAAIVEKMRRLLAV